MSETRLIVRKNLPDGGQSDLDVCQAPDIAAGSCKVATSQPVELRQSGSIKISNEFMKFHVRWETIQVTEAGAEAWVAFPSFLQRITRHRNNSMEGTGELHVVGVPARIDLDYRSSRPNRQSAITRCHRAHQHNQTSLGMNGHGSPLICSLDRITALMASNCALRQGNFSTAASVGIWRRTTLATHSVRVASPVETFRPLPLVCAPSPGPSPTPSP